MVPASESTWVRDPFQLQVEGDNLYGRGTTDCLGHVALLTDFMISLSERRIPLKRSITVIFIANEENSSFQGNIISSSYMGQIEIMVFRYRDWCGPANDRGIHGSIEEGSIVLDRCCRFTTLYWHSRSVGSIVPLCL